MTDPKTTPAGPRREIFRLLFSPKRIWLGMLIVLFLLLGIVALLGENPALALFICSAL